MYLKFNNFIFSINTYLPVSKWREAFVTGIGSYFRIYKYRSLSVPCVIDRNPATSQNRAPSTECHWWKAKDKCNVNTTGKKRIPCWEEAAGLSPCPYCIFFTEICLLLLKTINPKMKDLERFQPQSSIVGEFLLFEKLNFLLQRLMEILYCKKKKKNLGLRIKFPWEKWIF